MRRLCFAFAAVLLWAVPAEAQVFRDAALVSVQLVDAGSTIGHGRELNPLARPLAGHPAAFVATKAGVGVFTAWCVRKTAKDHPKAARWLTAAILGATGAAAVHNWRIR